MMFELFLGVPVMKLAAFVTPEIPAGQSLENLTWDTQPCIVCHVVIDPVAANFNHFTGNGGATAASKPCRNEGMRSPGFGFIELPGGGFEPRVVDTGAAAECSAPDDGVGEGEPDSDGPKRLKWLAERITEHPRFAYAVVVPLYEGIVGTKLLAPPDALALDVTDATFRVAPFDVDNGSAFTVRSPATVRAPTSTSSTPTAASSA